MKKILNQPTDVVTEMLDGLAYVHNDLVHRIEGFDIIARNEEKSGKVALISGGGSGHEPSHAGSVPGPRRCGVDGRSIPMRRPAAQRGGCTWSAVRNGDLLRPCGVDDSSSPGPLVAEPGRRRHQIRQLDDRGRHAEQ